MKVGLGAVAEGPMAQPLLSMVNHGCQCQVWADVWCPPGLQCNTGVEPQLVQPTLQPHRWGCAQFLLRLSTAIAIEAIERPIAIGSEIPNRLRLAYFLYLLPI
mgnify:CR=1 FL=1